MKLDEFKALLDNKVAEFVTKVNQSVKEPITAEDVDIRDHEGGLEFSVEKGKLFAIGMARGVLGQDGFAYESYTEVGSFDGKEDDDVYIEIDN